ncbi:MAG: resA [Chthonomonadales bacterium]|nr:resA [Chthonomonadales bacterium]
MKTTFLKTTLVLLSCVALSGLHIAGAAPAREPDRAAELLKRAYTESMRGRTLSADLVLTSAWEGRSLTTTGKVRAMKPYEGEWTGGDSPLEAPLPRFLGTLQISTSVKGSPEEPMKEEWIADGHQVMESMDIRKEYVKLSEDAFMSQAGFPVGCFFSAETFHILKTPRYLGKEHVDGVSYDVVEATLPGSRDGAYTLYFGASGLMEGYRTRFQDEYAHKEVTCTAWMKHIVVNSPMKPNEFVWAVPAGFSRYDPNAIDRALLPVAAPAPDFLLPRLGGEKIKLEDTRRTKKAVLVNFWYAGCGPCRAEFPHLQKLYERLKGKGLEVIAINRGDTDQQVQKVILEGKFTFPVALGGSKYGDGSVYANFGVMAFPTNYLIDADGKVVWRAMGYNDFASPEFKAALKHVGLE